MFCLPLVSPRLDQSCPHLSKSDHKSSVKLQDKLSEELLLTYSLGQNMPLRRAQGLLECCLVCYCQNHICQSSRCQNIILFSPTPHCFYRKLSLYGNSKPS